MAGEPLPSDDLAAMFDAAWQLLEHAVADPDAALRWPVVATIGADGPSARLMVLRSVDRDARTVCFYTDRRAPKVTELLANPHVAVTGYDPLTRLQLRLRGIGRVLSGASIVERWLGIGASGRRAYATTQPPGSQLSEPGSGLPDDIPSTDAQANFAVLEVTASQLEWLLLASTGHRRARYDHLDAGWQGSWRVP